MNQSAHVFALYCDQSFLNLKPFADSQSFNINNDQLIHRINTVLRLTKGEQILLFDGDCSALVTIVETPTKKKVVCLLEKKMSVQPLTPTLAVIMPILKRDAMEEAIYSAVELGVTSIHLTQLEKSQRQFSGDREIMRMKSIMIAAAEQSKNFCFPTLYPPTALATLCAQLTKAHGIACYADPNGKSYTSLLTPTHNNERFVIAFGPEGGFVENEVALLKKHNFVPCALTPTVLRAQQAFVVLAGMIRSIAK